MTLDLATVLDSRGKRATTTAGQLLGWVTASGVSTVTVRFADKTIATMPRLRTYAAPAVNDVVIVIKVGPALYCLGALNDGPSPPPADPPPAEGDGSSTVPPPAPVQRTLSFRPVSTGTWRAGNPGAWRTDTTDMLQGDASGGGINYGAAYYGTGPSGLTGAAVVGTVRIKRLPGGDPDAVRPTLRLLAEQDRPAGEPVDTAQLLGPLLAVDATATVELPDPWTQALIDGTAGGIGIGVDATTPYLVIAGKSSWPAAAELTITYTT